MNFIQKQLLNIAVKSGAVNLVNGSSLSSKWFGQNFNFNKYQNDSQLIEQGYGINTGVFACTKLSVDASVSIDFILLEQTQDGEEEVLSGDLYDILQNPNPNQVFKEFQEEALTYLNLTGDLFLQGTEAIGFGKAFQEIITLPSQKVELDINSFGKVTKYNYTTSDGRIVPLTPEEIYHGKYINPTEGGITNQRGLSPWQAGFRSVTASNELLTAQASVWANKGVSGLLTSNTDETLSSEEAKAVQEAVNLKLGGSHKVNGVAATTANVRFEQIGMASSDMQLIESDPQKLRYIAMLQGIDPALLGDPESRKYSNLKEAEKSLFVRSAIPNNERLISYLNRFLVPEWSKRDNKKYVIKQNLDGVEALQPDKKIEAEKNKIVSESVTALLSSPLSPEVKEMMLIDIHGYDEDKANTLANGTIEQGTNQGTQQEEGQED